VEYARASTSTGISSSARNRAKHGISFAQAVRIFEGRVVERIDDRFDYGEERIYAIGVVDGREVAVIYVEDQGEERRIISAWRARAYERRAYWAAAGPG